MELNDELFPKEIVEQAEFLYVKRRIELYSITYLIDFTKDGKSIFQSVIGSEFKKRFKNKDQVEQLKSFVYNDKMWQEIPFDDLIPDNSNVKKFKKVESE